MVSNVEKLYYYTDSDTPFPRILELLKKAAKEDIDKTIKLAFHLREPGKNGRGYREIGRTIFQWLFIQYPDEMKKEYKHIPSYGRWDDLFHLFPNVLPVYDKLFLEKNYNVKLSDEQYENVKKNQESVVYFYINQLKKDKKSMKKGEGVTFAGKWIPRETCMFNRKYGIVNTICDYWKLSPRILRREYTTPLRKYSNVVEVKMCAKEKIDYTRLPSSSLYRYRKYFTNNDCLEFNEWLNRARPKLIPSLYPHEICMMYNTPFIKSYMHSVDLNIEYQWNTFIEKAMDNKNFKNCFSIVDVNERMKREGELYEYNCKYFINIAIAYALFMDSLCENKEIKGTIGCYNNPIRKYPVVQNRTFHQKLKEILHIMMPGQDLCQEDLINKLKEFKKKPERVYIFTNKRYTDVFEDFDLLKYTKSFKKKKGKKEKGVKEKDDDKSKDEEECVIPDIYFWNLESKSITMNRINTNLFYIEGNSKELIESFFTNGFSNLSEEIDTILDEY